MIRFKIAKRVIPTRWLRLRSRRGASQVEMALCTFLMVMLLLAIVDFSRMMIVFTAVSNAARAGTRYAIVHGTDRSKATGVDGASGPSDYSQVTTVVQNFASTGLLDKSKLTIAVNYPDSSNTAGSRVSVSVSYPFTPLIGYFPLSTTLANTSEGVITF